MSDDFYPPPPWEIRNTLFDDRAKRLLALSEAQWWEYKRKEKAMYCIFPKAVKILESLEEVNQAIDLNKKELQHFFRSELAQWGLGILFGAISAKIPSQSIGITILAWVWLFWLQQKPSLESGNLKRESYRLKLLYADLEKEFIEHFGRSLQFKELVQAWDSPGFELNEKLEDAALVEIERFSQKAYREHLEKLVKMHTV